MNIKSPYYPNEFFDFTDGVKIDNYTTQKWIDEAVEYLEENISSEYYYTSSGNTMVVVFRANPQADGCRYIVKVSKSHAEAVIE